MLNAFAASAKSVYAAEERSWRWLPGSMFPLLSIERRRRLAHSVTTRIEPRNPCAFKTLRAFYIENESDLVRDAIINVVSFFDWAHKSRNVILHSERYPPSFGSDPGVLYLTKRASKRDYSSRYIAADLSVLRSTAENMRKGIIRSAEINIYVRFRKENLSEVDLSIRAYVESPDFTPL